jgi:hypothetical protein
MADKDFTYNTKGASIGGPIIKNKLFFFVSGEQERLSSPGTTLTALKAGQTAGGEVFHKLQLADLDCAKNFLN